MYVYDIHVCNFVAYIVFSREIVGKISDQRRSTKRGRGDKVADEQGKRHLNRQNKSWIKQKLQ